MSTEQPRQPDLQALVDTCVHCGFCLPTCPTYQLWGQEMDSPRGRIQLMQLGLSGEPLTDPTVTHLDRCLGCMACVTSCPSGVRYDRLITAYRAEVESSHSRSWRERVLRTAIFGLFPYPRRLRVLRGPLRLGQATGLDRVATRGLARVSPSLATMAALAPRLGRRPAVPARVPAAGRRRAVVGMLLGCVQRELFPQVNAATARVLAAEGCEVLVPPGQGCCGALSLHTGRQAEARRFARRTASSFRRAGVDAVIVNAAGCGSAMKEYQELGVDGIAGRVRDLSEWLVELGPVAPRRPVPVTVAYHDACHLSHAQGIREQPRRLLAQIPELSVREIADRETCCGSAGVYNLLQPGPAAALGDRKAAQVAATGAELLVSANPGCAMQIAAAAGRAGRRLPVAHLAEVLDASICGTGWPGPARGRASRSGAC